MTSRSDLERSGNSAPKAPTTRGRQLNPYEVAALKDTLGHETYDSMHPYTKDRSIRIGEAYPPESTPLPPIGRHTEVLETPNPRGRARESPNKLSSLAHRRHKSREGRDNKEKRSPDVPPPDLKKLKREPESADAEMPDFGSTQARTSVPGQGSGGSEGISGDGLNLPNSDEVTPLPEISSLNSGNMHAKPVLNLSASAMPGVNSDAACVHAPKPALHVKSDIAKPPIANPTTTFDLTIDDDDADLAEEGEQLTTKDSQASLHPPEHLPDELDAANTEKPSPPRSKPVPVPGSGVGMYPLPCEAPPWIQDLHAGIMGLHNKVDLSRSEMAHFGAELQQQGIRVSGLETISSDHSQQLQEAQKQILQLETRIKELDKVQGLERRIAELEASKRSLTPPRSPRGDVSPRSPRSSVGSREDSNNDLDIVIGGWTDARRSDAQQEVTNMFKAIHMPDAIKEMWAPYSRTNFIKVQLSFPNESSHISVRRLYQLQIIEKLKVMKFTSGVQGSVGSKIWATKSKSPDERAKVRALVVTKEFLKALPGRNGASPIPENELEIVWNGRLFYQQHQFLGCMDRDGEPCSEDYILSDSRGNHMAWFVKASVFEAATGYPGTELADLWEKYCPSNN